MEDTPGEGQEAVEAPARAPVAPPPPRPAWAVGAGATSVAPTLAESALAVTYLRRLGYGAEEAASLASGEPFKGASAKALLSSLVQRHVLRIPFENLEYHQQEVQLDQTLLRLRNPRLTVERIAFGWTGGLSFDLNFAFAWLLRELGASARLAAACPAGDEGFAGQATHLTVLVDLPDGTFVADPGFPDPPRAAVKADGSEAADDLSWLEVTVAVDGEQPPAAFEKVLRRTRGSNSLCRHVENPDTPELDGAEAATTALFAFRPGDNLAFDSPEAQGIIKSALTKDSPLVERRLVCLGLPKGHIVLSECRSRRVEGGVVMEEVSVDSPGIWQKLAGAIFGRPFLAGDLKVGKPLASRSAVTRSSASQETASESRDSASAKSKNWGTIGSSSIAVGGAGAGGGMGLNAPGFGPKVQHFAGRGSASGMRSVVVDEEIKKTWAQVMDDGDPIGWLFCEYAADGKTLELKSKGEGGLKDFKGQLGTAMGWGGFRCCGVDKRGGLECKRPKFIFVQYKPESAPAIKKAKQGSHKGDVKDAMAGAHIDVVVENSEQDLEEQALITKLQAATGAHKPNGYEFEEGVFLEADFYGLGIGKDCRDETSKN